MESFSLEIPTPVSPSPFLGQLHPGEVGSGQEEESKSQGPGEIEGRRQGRFRLFLSPSPGAL